MGNIKEMNIQNRTYIFITLDTSQQKIYSVNPLYFIIGKADGLIEESNGNKYLVFASTNKN